MTELQRVKKIIKWLIYTEFAESERDLAEKLGYTKSSLSQIVTGKVPLSDKFVNKLCAIDENINNEWIASGEGEMLKNTVTSNLNDQHLGSYVPLLPISAQGGSLNDFVVAVSMSDCEKIISPIKDVDFAITVAGESMAPDYPSGSQILIKRINTKAFIEWGKVYVLDTCNGTIVKEIRKGDDESYIVCHSINPNPKFEPFNVAMGDIYGMYRVMLSMSIR